MAKLTDEEKERLIKRYLPGYKLVTEEESDPSADTKASETSDAGTPDLESLKQKYFGTVGEVPDAVAADSLPDDDADEIVQVEPERRSNALDRGSRAKSIVISGNEIKGGQG